MSIFELINTRVKKTGEKYSDLLLKRSQTDKAGIGFMLYSLEQLFNYKDFDELEEGIVDSSYREETHDYGIDAIYLTCNKEFVRSIEEFEDYNEDSKFKFHILQFKKGKGLNQENFLKFKEGIKKVFINNDCKESFNKFMFSRMRDINEIKSNLYEKFSSDQISIYLYMVFNGLKNTVEKDPLLSAQINETKSLLSEKGYPNNNYDIIDAQKLIDLEKKGEEIVDLIQFEKSFKYIKEIGNDKKLTGYISIISGEEIAKLVKKWQASLFEANIRDYYKKSDLNSYILKTCSSDDEAKYFWSFNNGLTIICRKVEELPNDTYRLYGCQIVNGCQTSNALYLAYNNRDRANSLNQKQQLRKDEKTELEKIKNNTLNNDSNILVKIIVTNNPELIFRITETTNSQTPIKTFSLKANDDIQKIIELYLLENKIYYERRINYYKNQGKRNIISIQKLFQLYVSQLLYKPSQVKTTPKQMFQSLYDNVFPTPSVKQINHLLYLIPIKIDMKLNKLIRYIQRNKQEPDSYKSELLSYGKLHLGCFILHSILENDYNLKSIVDNSKLIQKIIESDIKFEMHFNNALNNLKYVVQNYAGRRKESILAALRKADLDTRIAKFIKKKK